MKNNVKLLLGLIFEHSAKALESTKDCKDETTTPKIKEQLAVIEAHLEKAFRLAAKMSGGSTLAK